MADVSVRAIRDSIGAPAVDGAVRDTPVELDEANRSDQVSEPNSLRLQSAPPEQVRERYVDAFVDGPNATKSRCPGEPEPVTRTLQPTLTLGGGLGWHRNEWEPLLKEAAYDIGVELEMVELNRSWWRGTEYELKVTGAPEDVQKFAEKYPRMRRYYGATHG